MDDVRELVGENEPKPVVGVEFRTWWPGRIDHDGVVGQRRCVAVRQVGLVGDDDMRHPRRAATEPPVDLCPCFFSDGGQIGCQPCTALIEIDAEVRGWLDPEPERRIEPRRAFSCGRRDAQKCES